MNKPTADWQKVEYQELNMYGRTAIETIHRLANMTFVINPALGVGFYYVFFEKRDHAFFNIGYIGIFIALLGVLYNIGALSVYLGSHRLLRELLIRMRDIDRTTHLKLHEAIEVSAPHSYRKYWGSNNPRTIFSGDYFTRIFLGVLCLVWLAVATVSARKLLYG